MVADEDERLKIDGDPEEALRGLLDDSGATNFVVKIAEAEAGQDFPEGPIGPNDPSPILRVAEWRGSAKSHDEALHLARTKFAQEYGELPTNYRATVHVVGH